MEPSGSGHYFLFFRFVLFQNITEDTFGQVVQCDNAFCAAILVNNNSELVFVLLK